MKCLTYRISTRDIFIKINQRLIEKGYYEKNIEEKKLLVTEELKIYLQRKILDYKPQIRVEDLENLDLNDLLIIVYSDSGDNKEVIYQLIHYLLGIMSDMQGFYIAWFSPFKNNINIPIIKEENGLIEELVTPLDINSVTIFNFVYEFFKAHNFEDQLARKRIIPKLPKNGD